MTISYPLAFPSTNTAARVTFTGRDIAGVSESPFDGSQQVYDWQAGMLRAAIELPPMEREDAEVWVAWLLSLYGQTGTFLMGDPANRTPRGTWLGSPVVNGAHAAQARVLNITGLNPGATGKAGDWLQVGTGSSARLHKNLSDFVAGSPGDVALDIWPPLSGALSTLSAVVTSSPVGLFRRVSGECPWSIDTAHFYGISFDARSAL